MRTLPLYVEPPTLAVEREPARARDGSCSLCALSKKARTVCMAAEMTGAEAGPVLYVLGQGPGEQEDRAGRPNVGSSGSFLRDLLQRFWPGRVVFDNAVRCPPGKKTPPAAIKACRGYGAQIFQDSQAVRVLALGADAIHSFLGEGQPPLSVRRGYAYTSTGVPVFLLMHPAAALRNRFLRGWFEEDLRWALTAEPPLPPLDGVAYLVETETDAQQAIADLQLAPWVTWDLETYGAVGNNEFRILDAAAVPAGASYAYVWERQVLDTPAVAAPLLDLLESTETEHGGWNIKFDEAGIRQRYKRTIRASFDTMIWRRLLEGSVELYLETAQALVGMLGGKDVAKKHVKDGVAQLRKALKKGMPVDTSWWHSAPHDPEQNLAELELAIERVREGDDPNRYAYAAIPPEERARYNALDTLSTDRLCGLYREQMAATEEGQRQWRVWTKVAKGMAHALATMEYNGVLVSRPKIKELAERMRAEMAKQEKIVSDFLGGSSINLNAAPQVAAVLYDVAELPCSRVTEKTGARSTDAASLEKLDHPVATAIIAWRSASKFLSQYSEGIEEAIRDDGRVHANTRVVGTETGRPSCNDPNLFNLRRPDDDIGVLVRDILVASEGYEFVEADQSQVELRVAAMLSGDKVMIEAYKNNIDMHLDSAKFVAEKTKQYDPATITKQHPLRARTKSIVFGTLYGEPPYSQAQKLGISRKEAESLQKLILGRFPELARWIQAQLALARRTGQCFTTWEGEKFRRRLLTAIGDQDEQARVTAERSSWNTPIQGTAADYTNASLWAVQEYIERERVPARLVLTVYDSILLEVRKDVVVPVSRRVQQIMESWPTMNGVPLKAELKRGKAYGSLVEFHPDKEEQVA